MRMVARRAFVMLIVVLTFSTGLNAQAVMRAATERVSNVGPMRASLVSSSDLRSYYFYNPFMIRNVNSAGDQFGYNASTNTLNFFIERMGETHSREKRLYLIFNNVDVEFVKASRITSGYDETYMVRTYESVSAPDHSIFNVLPSGAGSMLKQSKGYDLGTSDWQGGVSIEVKFNRRIDDDFIITVMVAHPNHIRRIGEEVIQHFAAPLRLLGRVLGESRYSDYISFANFHFEHTAFGSKACSNLLLTSNSYSETSSLSREVNRELGTGYDLADWNDLKSIRDIDAWIACMGLQNDQSFMVTMNGNYRFGNSNRQYFVRYAPGGVPSSFAVHDRIADKLFLGSWHGLRQKVLVKKR